MSRLYSQRNRDKQKRQVEDLTGEKDRLQQESIELDRERRELLTKLEAAKSENDFLKLSKVDQTVLSRNFVAAPPSMTSSPHPAPPSSSAGMATTVATTAATAPTVTVPLNAAAVAVGQAEAAVAQFLESLLMTRIYASSKISSPNDGSSGHSAAGHPQQQQKQSPVSLTQSQHHHHHFHHHIYHQNSQEQARHIQASGGGGEGVQTRPALNGLKIQASPLIGPQGGAIVPGHALGSSSIPLPPQTVSILGLLRHHQFSGQTGQSEETKESLPSSSSSPAAAQGQGESLSTQNNTAASSSPVTNGATTGRNNDISTPVVNGYLFQPQGERK